MYSIVLMAALTTGAEAPSFLFFGCHGCHGCHGCRGCNGCGGCYGACHGCSGCYGMGGSCYGCWGCRGGCHGCSGSACNGCGGGCGGCAGYACAGGGCYGVATTPYRVITPAAEPAPTPRAKEGAAATERARLIVEVPADAKVFIDDRPTRESTSTTRTFHTPELVAGEAYFYDLRIETIRDGKAVTETRRVSFSAGNDIRVSFRPETPATTTAAR